MVTYGVYKLWKTMFTKEVLMKDCLSAYREGELTLNEFLDIKDALDNEDLIKAFTELYSAWYKTDIEC